MPFATAFTLPVQPGPCLAVRPNAIRPYIVAAVSDRRASIGDRRYSHSRRGEFTRHGGVKPPLRRIDRWGRGQAGGFTTWRMRPFSAWTGCVELNLQEVPSGDHRVENAGPKCQLHEVSRTEGPKRQTSKSRSLRQPAVWHQLLESCRRPAVWKPVHWRTTRYAPRAGGCWQCRIQDGSRSYLASAP
jgi:hypothetical protein